MLVEYTIPRLFNRGRDGKTHPVSVHVILRDGIEKNRCDRDCGMRGNILQA